MVMISNLLKNMATISCSHELLQKRKLWLISAIFTDTEHSYELIWINKLIVGLNNTQLSQRLSLVHMFSTHVLLHSHVQYSTYELDLAWNSWTVSHHYIYFENHCMWHIFCWIDNLEITVICTTKVLKYSVTAGWMRKYSKVYGHHPGRSCWKTIVGLVQIVQCSLFIVNGTFNHTGMLKIFCWEHIPLKLKKLGNTGAILSLNKEHE